jgi:hypothetical protein
MREVSSELSGIEAEAVRGWTIAVTRGARVVMRGRIVGLVAVIC